MRTAPTGSGSENHAGLPASGDPGFTAEVEAWFRRERRRLPWREPAGDGRSRDPYHALVSEFMLQQTQVSRVLEKFPLFIQRFPSVECLARADEHDVLALWSGLGYYRRARSLHAAAKAVVERFGGRVPAEVEELVTLPGVGRYTAGAISSIAFGRPAPIVDGNVARVLMRIEGRDAPQTDPETVNWCWRRAGELATAAEDPAAFNEGLMELGATVCTPRAPRCLYCPVRERCVAFATDRQDEIPPPKPRARQSELHAAVVLIRGAGGRLLVERRPSVGLWASLWQAPTLERDDRPSRAGELRAAFGLASVRKREAFTFKTTHRIVRFTVYEGEAADPGNAADPALPRAWRTAEEIAKLALSNPQRRILLGAPGAAS